MEYVYVLSGREWLANNEWGYGCEDASVLGVYSNFETAKNVFKEKVLEAARNVVDSDDDFKYTEDGLFESKDADEETYGWYCCIGEDHCDWELCLPEGDDFDFGFWFLPNLSVRKCKIQ